MEISLRLLLAPAEGIRQRRRSLLDLESDGMVMTDAEKALFANATPAAKKLFSEAQKLQRQKRREEWKTAQLKQAQLTPVPAQSAFAVRPDKTQND